MGVVVKKLKRAAVGATTVLAIWAGAMAIAQAAVFVAHAEAAEVTGYSLKRVVVVMRHGIRPPTKAQPVSAGLTAEAWPSWDVPYGDLTGHGEQAVSRLAELDRAEYRSVFLSKCPRVHAWADTDQRTLKTAQVYVDKAFPGCHVRVGHVAEGRADPRFSPFAAPPLADEALMRKAAEEALPAEGLAGVDAQQRARLDRLSAIMGCAQISCRLSSRPTQFVAKEGKVKIDGGIDTASTVAQVLLLEYADGKPMAQVGWGRTDRATIADLSALHALEFQLVARPKAIANYGAHALSQDIRSGLFDRKASPFTVLVGHDSNLAYLGGALDLHWQAGDLSADDPAPGGALIFELWRNRKGAEIVRVRYRAQGLDQMRNLTPLTPKASQALTIPGCGGQDCTATQFKALLP